MNKYPKVDFLVPCSILVDGFGMKEDMIMAVRYGRKQKTTRKEERRKKKEKKKTMMLFFENVNRCEGVGGGEWLVQSPLHQ